MIEINLDQVASAAASQRAYDRLYGRSFSGVWTGQMDSRYIWLVSLLRSQPGQRLLDVSCGNGYLLRAAMRRRLDAWGLDLSPVGIQQAGAMAPDASLICGNAETLPFASDSFDYVTNIGSVEHYVHPAASVAEMARVLKPRGLALILVPNVYGLLGNILHVWRYGDVFVDVQPLQRYATRGWWSGLLEGNGLSIVRTLRYERELPRTWEDLRWHLAHPGKLLRALLGPLVPLNLTDSFVFLCTRRNQDHA
jgi:SAM-dependent methyltransferase